MKENGFTMVKKESQYNFLKWGEYMKRAQIAERKVEKLKALLLLVDPAVSSVIGGDTQLVQWSEYIKCFPDEGLPEVNF